MCNCIENLGKEFSEKIGKNVFPENLDLLSNKLFITFKPIGKSKRNEEVNIFITNCPFCGKEIENEKQS